MLKQGGNDLYSAVQSLDKENKRAQIMNCVDNQYIRL